jgi:hypothetical protein
MVSPAFKDRWIYHFTHLDNLRAILDDGYLACDVTARQGKIQTEVGDPDIKESRRQRPILAGPGGQVGDYVPFYFATRSPMMFRIACDHRDSRAGCYPGGDRPLVYLVTSVGSVVDAALRWVATDGNAATATTEFTSDLQAVEAMVDWPLMTAERWSNSAEDMDRQRRRQAEFLVHQRLSTDLVRWIGTYSDHYGSRVRSLLADDPLAERIIVRPAWYYGYERR